MIALEPPFLVSILELFWRAVSFFENSDWFSWIEFTTYFLIAQNVVSGVVTPSL